MAITTYKQRAAPLIDETTDKPSNPLDPLSDIYAGIGSDGLPYVWQNLGSGFHWDLMTLQQESYWCQLWDYDKKKIFYSKTDANGDLIDSWFWGKDIKMLIIENLPWTQDQFTKDLNSDRTDFPPGGAPNPLTECLIFTN